MESASEFEVPPCGAGLNTVIAGVPAAARSAAGIVAESSEDETKMVGRLEPANCTEEFARKLVPATVRVISPDPADTIVGLMPVTVGIGALTLKVCAVDVPPVVPGVFTVTGTDEAAARSVAGIAAFNCVLSR